MESEMWTSPPLDILLYVFRRLDITNVVRCAGTCKPWRRAIVGNAASCLQPRPDRFIPNLFLGFFFDKINSDAAGVSLQLTPGPFEPVFVMPTAGTAVGEDIALYNKLLSCRDGLLLLKGREVDGLCLYNTMTRDHTFIPAAAFEPHNYVLITGYDMSPSDNLGARILAVIVEDDADGHSTFAFRHQQFCCPASGAATWSPVKRSQEFAKDDCTSISLGNQEVICGGAVHWLGVWTPMALNIFGDDDDVTVEETQVFALDVDTGRTWATKLPDQCQDGYSWSSHVLTTSWRHQDSCIKVWVLVSEDQYGRLRGRSPRLQ